MSPIFGEEITDSAARRAHHFAAEYAKETGRFPKDDPTAAKTFVSEVWTLTAQDLRREDATEHEIEIAGEKFLETIWSVDQATAPPRRKPPTKKTLRAARLAADALARVYGPENITRREPTMAILALAATLTQRGRAPRSTSADLEQLAQRLRDTCDQWTREHA